MFYGVVSCCVDTPASGSANKIVFVNNIDNGNGNGNKLLEN
jgi:hypothetical protein